MFKILVCSIHFLNVNRKDCIINVRLGQLKVILEGVNHIIFLLPGLEKKFVSDFSVVNNVMREGD